MWNPGGAGAVFLVISAPSFTHTGSVSNDSIVVTYKSQKRGHYTILARITDTGSSLDVHIAGDLAIPVLGNVALILGLALAPVMFTIQTGLWRLAPGLLYLAIVAWSVIDARKRIAALTDDVARLFA